MSIDTGRTSEQASATRADADDVLDAVYRDLVQIHAAMAERKSEDREVKAWAQRELMDVIREVGAFRREHPRQAVS